MFVQQEPLRGESAVYSSDREAQTSAARSSACWPTLEPKPTLYKTYTVTIDLWTKAQDHTDLQKGIKSAKLCVPAANFMHTHHLLSAVKTGKGQGCLLFWGCHCINNSCSWSLALVRGLQQGLQDVHCLIGRPCLATDNHRGTGFGRR